jgi:hypothetical protein
MEVVRFNFDPPPTAEQYVDFTVNCVRAAAGPEALYPSGAPTFTFDASALRANLPSLPTDAPVDQELVLNLAPLFYELTHRE